MNALGSVLLVDDGELQEARSVLDALDVQIDHLRGDPRPADLEPPYDLVVSNVRRAAAVAEALEQANDGAATGEAVKPAWIAIHGQDFLPLRDRLRRSGVDYLVVSSVDSQVLRLLFLHALYGGPERRGAVRVPVGVEVGFALKHGEGTAHLLDLTMRGCRILGAAPVGAGMNIVLRFPSGLTAGRELELGGRIVRVERAPGSGQPSAAIRFGELEERARACLEAILQGHAIGTRVTPLLGSAPPPRETAAEPRAARAPAAMPRGAHVTAALEEPTEDAAEDTAEDELTLEHEERRGLPRTSYTRKVTAVTAGATHILIARDLSMQGMRIAPQSGLRVGSRMRLSIFGGPRQRPVVLPAKVLHDEGEMGMVLRFETVKSPEKERLAAMIAEQPEVELLSGDAPTSGRVVVTESLFDDLGDELDAIFEGEDKPTDS